MPQLFFFAYSNKNDCLKIGAFSLMLLKFEFVCLVARMNDFAFKICMHILRIFIMRTFIF